MAYQTIKTLRLFEYEQPELTEEKEVVNDSGEVVTEVTVTQVSLHTWVDLIIQQEQDTTKNLSHVRAYLKASAKAGANCTFTRSSASSNYLRGRESEDSYYWTSVTGTTAQTASFYANTTYTNTLATWVTTSVKRTNMSVNYWNLYHNFIDGARSILLSGEYRYSIVSNDGILNKSFSANVDERTIDLTPIDKSTKINTATNFNDEENPSFTYSVFPVIKDLANNSYYDYGQYRSEEITQVQAALSFDGSTIDVNYRDIPIDATSYTFNLTEAEKEVLRAKTQGSNVVPIYFITKTTRVLHYNSNGTDSSIYPAIAAEFINKLERTITIIGCVPTLNPTVKDIKPETLALTGNENIFVRYESMVEFSTGATASKYATIVSQSVQCGSKTVYNLYNGVIDDIESGSFIFNATDSRGLHADTVVVTNTSMIEYVKPTIKQDVQITISGETGAVVTVKVSGVCFNGSFGAVNNTLKLEARYQVGSGSMGNWTTLSGTPSFNGNNYELTATFSGLSYEEAYTFQVRAIDKLNTVESSQYTTRLMPVFDWSETDFNFNVPVNMNAEDFTMHNETVLRHSNSTNNTVLSASNGHIYLRPKGTDNTSGQTILYNNGNVDFSGIVNFSNSFTIGGYILNDYVIETGSEAMGSNGTWYWQKWLSGKAEAWGCRNFGNMAVTTAWGNLYRSAIFTQDLPDNVFIRTPDSININIVHGGYGGWICKHEQTAPSAVTTGSFIYVRPASATITPTNLGFHIIGEWY